MSGLFGRSYEPDNRPGTGAMIVAIVLALIVVFLVWLLSVLSTPI